MTRLEKWLGVCAEKTIKREEPTIIAITGTVGKSSAKQAIGAILHADEPEAHVRVSAKNYNNELGLPLTIFGLDAPGRSVKKWLQLLWIAWTTSLGWRHTNIRTFVLEMGADHPGDLAYLTSIAPPTIAVITAVTPQDASLAPVHLANYASIDALAEEKATLVKSVCEGCTVILNADDKRVFSMRHLTTAHVMTFGEADGADIRLAQTWITNQETEFGMEPMGRGMEIESLNRIRKMEVKGVFGKPVAYAVCAAIAVAAALDLGPDAVMSLPEHFIPLPGRTRIIPGTKHTILLDDTYNSSPAAVISALNDLASITIRPGQRRVACLGEMRELGNTSQDLHRLIGVEAAKQGIDLLVACGTLAHVMAEGARANGMREDQIKIFADTPEAAIFLQQWIKPGDIILAKASQGSLHDKGVRMERVVKELMAEPLRAKELLVRQDAAWERK